MEASGDHKSWVREKEMLALITAGAKVIKNLKQYDGIYVTEVIYEEINFINASRNPLIPTNLILH